MGYMNKFKGKYRLRCDIDESIGEFARDEKGVFVDNDVYIDCGNNGRIYHYGGSTLEAWVGDINKGTSKNSTFRKVLLEVGGIKIDKDYNVIYPKGDRIINNVIVGDGEGSFQFNVKYVDDVAKLMKARTSGKNISPFSKKNLPKEKYDIPESDIVNMKSVTKGLEVQQIMRAYREFGKANKVEPNKIAIHKAGLWNELTDFIGENAKNL